MTTFAVRTVLAAVLAMLVPVGAEAAYDVSGKWLLVPRGHQVSRLELTQGAGTLSSPPVYPDLPIHWDGTIDEGTGAFALTLPFGSYNPCGDFTLAGNVAADGRSFDATLVEKVLVPDEGASTESCQTFTTTVAGTRCGNNQVDAWEECDFGDADDGDCCSSSCLLADTGSACTSDTNDCTSDVCNSAGTCDHNAVAGSCNEPHGCGSGQCSAGNCVVSAPTPAGTSCDLDSTVCTIDACDGAGACVAGDYLDCRPCGKCDPVQGCIRGGPLVENRPCVSGTNAIDLTVLTGAMGKRKSLRLSVKDAAFPYESADPTVDTWLFACLYEDDGVLSRPIFGAMVAPAGDCGGSPCWQVRRYGYRYRDKMAAADGILSVKYDDDSFQLLARGGNLLLPSELSTTSALVPLIGTWTDGDYFTSGACWSHPVTSRRRSERMFRGGYKP